MTDPDMADATYIEPITPEIVAKIIEKERPDALLPTMGGQTALNTALALFNDGTLEKYGVEMIGADAEAIDKAEDRLRSARRWTRSGSNRRARVVPNAGSRRCGAGTHRPARDHPPQLHAGRHRRRHRL
jgi:carbamoylphosphate synthase large subunit